MRAANWLSINRSSRRACLAPACLKAASSARPCSAKSRRCARRSRAGPISSVPRDGSSTTTIPLARGLLSDSGEGGVRGRAGLLAWPLRRAQRGRRAPELASFLRDDETFLWVDECLVATSEPPAGRGICPIAAHGALTRCFKLELETFA